MSNLDCLANVSIAKDKYIARLQQRMPEAIQALAATITTRAASASSDTRREKSRPSGNASGVWLAGECAWGVERSSGPRATFPN